MGIGSWVGACSEEGEEVVHLENAIHSLAQFVERVEITEVLNGPF